jgi:hypothetical protein
MGTPEDRKGLRDNRTKGFATLRLPHPVRASSGFHRHSEIDAPNAVASVHESRPPERAKTACRQIRGAANVPARVSRTLGAVSRNRLGRAVMDCANFAVVAGSACPP